MSKFRFDRLIEVKENLLNEKKKDLKKTTDLYEGISMEITITEDNIKRDFSRIAEPDTDSNDIYVLREHIIWLEARKSRLSEERRTTLEKIEILRVELGEILKEIKTLETLKNRALQVMRKEANKKEQKKLDELALRVNPKQ
ncbi:MAG: flagellar FliJ family protein [Syntrophorhabdaceae bacterium]|nr:flagellar FliJ family protein [Syntrophorhabdales bacterium]MBP9560333.1 flagellar FliJ family protein [Syntrophorhabdaceae bacterium]